jgi:hypothetical protein
LSVHAVLQEANAWLMLDDPAACRRTLDRIDAARLETMAALVITVAAEAARYHALDASCARRAGRTTASVRANVEDHLRRVAVIVTGHPANRVEFLRTLFFAMTARDVEALLRS